MLRLRLSYNSLACCLFISFFVCATSASDLCQFTVSVCRFQEESTTSDGHLLQLRFWWTHAHLFPYSGWCLWVLRGHYVPILHLYYFPLAQRPIINIYVRVLVVGFWDIHVMSFSHSISFIQWQPGESLLHFFWFLSLSSLIPPSAMAQHFNSHHFVRDDLLSYTLNNVLLVVSILNLSVQEVSFMSLQP